tara:strand:- start:277 stop:1815 length:1539 start_codon:yes stop_codon:yes gene_type:complete
MIKDLLKLFQGDPNQYLTTVLTGTVDERGKHEAKCTTVHEPVTEDIWDKHIKGEIRIGIRPEKEDLVKWGCIDIDPRSYKDYASKKYLDIIKNNNLPLVPTRSKSGGLHLFIFLKDWSDKKRLLKVLHFWNDKYFLSKEVFPMNKAVNMPYFNAEATTEHGYENNIPILIGRFIDYAKTQIISLENLEKIKTDVYEPESRWSEYPPCVQSMINEKWSGNHRNDLLFNIGVMEMRKADGELSKKELLEILIDRNTQVFDTPLSPQEIKTTILSSLSKKNYTLKCNTPLCSKDKCKHRALGIGTQPPDIVNDFTNITYTRYMKTIEYSFKYQDEEITVRPEDMVDEKAWRKKLLGFRIYWKTLERPKKAPPPFELLMHHIVCNATEDTESKWLDVLNEEQYDILKKFFEDHLEVDDYKKIKDGFVVVDSKTQICYFKQNTLKRFISGKKYFNTTKEAMKLLDCQHLDYHEGEKNVWSVKMPEFVVYKEVKKKAPQKKNQISELDDEYHTGKFRT